MSSKGNRGPILVYTAGADVTEHRIVKQSADDKVIHSTATVADAHLGISDRPAKSGDPVDVHVFGVVSCKYGGAVTRGALVKADATGRAVVAAATDRVVGQALVAGVEDDIGKVLVNPGVA